MLWPEWNALTLWTTGLGLASGEGGIFVPPPDAIFGLVVAAWCAVVVARNKRLEAAVAARRQLGVRRGRWEDEDDELDAAAQPILPALIQQLGYLVGSLATLAVLSTALLFASNEVFEGSFGLLLAISTARAFVIEALFEGVALYFAQPTISEKALRRTLRVVLVWSTVFAGITAATVALYFFEEDWTAPRLFFSALNGGIAAVYCVCVFWLGWGRPSLRAYATFTIAWRTTAAVGLALSAAAPQLNGAPALAVDAAFLCLQVFGFPASVYAALTIDTLYWRGRLRDVSSAADADENDGRRDHQQREDNAAYSTMLLISAGAPSGGASDRRGGGPGVRVPFTQQNSDSSSTTGAPAWMTWLSRPLSRLRYGRRWRTFQDDALPPQRTRSAGAAQFATIDGVTRKHAPRLSLTQRARASSRRFTGTLLGVGDVGIGLGLRGVADQVMLAWDTSLTSIASLASLPPTVSSWGGPSSASSNNTIDDADAAHSTFGTATGNTRGGAAVTAAATKRAVSAPSSGSSASSTMGRARRPVTESSPLIVELATRRPAAAAATAAGATAVQSSPNVDNATVSTALPLVPKNTSSRAVTNVAAIAAEDDTVTTIEVDDEDDDVNSLDSHTTPPDTPAEAFSLIQRQQQRQVALLHLSHSLRSWAVRDSAHIPDGPLDDLQALMEGVRSFAPRLLLPYARLRLTEPVHHGSMAVVWRGEYRLSRGDERAGVRAAPAPASSLSVPRASSGGASSSLLPVAVKVFKPMLWNSTDLAVFAQEVYITAALSLIPASPRALCGAPAASPFSPSIIPFVGLCVCPPDVAIITYWAAGGGGAGNVRAWLDEQLDADERRAAARGYNGTAAAVSLGGSSQESFVHDSISSSSSAAPRSTSASTATSTSGSIAASTATATAPPVPVSTNPGPSPGRGRLYIPVRYIVPQQQQQRDIDTEAAGASASHCAFSPESEVEVAALRAVDASKLTLAEGSCTFHTGPARLPNGSPSIDTQPLQRRSQHHLDAQLRADMPFLGGCPLCASDFPFSNTAQWPMDDVAALEQCWQFDPATAGAGTGGGDSVTAPARGVVNSANIAVQGNARESATAATPNSPSRAPSKSKSYSGRLWRARLRVASEIASAVALMHAEPRCRDFTAAAQQQQQQQLLGNAAALAPSTRALSNTSVSLPSSPAAAAAAAAAESASRNRGCCSLFKGGCCGGSSRGVAAASAGFCRGPILHRDLKSLNVLLDASGSALLSDFGDAKPLPCSLSSSDASSSSDAAPFSCGSCATSPDSFLSLIADAQRRGSEARYSSNAVDAQDDAADAERGSCCGRGAGTEPSRALRSGLLHSRNSSSSSSNRSGPAPMTGNRGTPNWSAPEVMVPGHANSLWRSRPGAAAAPASASSFDKNEAPVTIDSVSGGGGGVIDYGTPADVHSLGCIIWELITGGTPYAGCTKGEIVLAVGVRRARPPIPHCAPRALAHLLRCCWHPVPDRRPTAAMVADVLVRMLRATAGA